MKILVTLATESSADKFVFPTFTIKNRAQVIGILNTAVTLSIRLQRLI